MPQLDLYSLGNQFFWGFLFFALFYYFVSYLVIPSVFSILFARTFYSSKLTSDSLNLISFCFAFITVSNVVYSEFFFSMNTLLENVYLSKLTYSVVLDEIFTTELNSLYELTYFNDDEQ